MIGCPLYLSQADRRCSIANCWRNQSRSATLFFFEADRIKVSHVGVKFHLGSINENEGWNEWNVVCPDWISSIRCWWSQVSTNLCLMKCPWPTPSWLNYWAYDKYDNGFKWLTPQMWLPNSENVQDPSRNWKNHSPKTSSWTAISIGKKTKKNSLELGVPWSTLFSNIERTKLLVSLKIGNPIVFHSYVSSP